MAAAVTPMTAEQYHAWSVEGDRTQLVEGEVIVNDPKPMHAVLQGELLFVLGAWIRAGEGRGLAIPPTSLTMDERNVFGPDILWFSEENIPPDLYEYPEHVADLCVEIRSPGTWRYDVGAKRAVYERGGLPELWLVDDRAQSVLVCRRSAPAEPTFDVALELACGEALTSPQLPGFALSLDELFAV